MRVISAQQGWETIGTTAIDTTATDTTDTDDPTLWLLPEH